MGQVTTILVHVEVLAHPYFRPCFIHVAKLVRLCFIRTKQAEVLWVQLDDVAEEVGKVAHTAHLCNTTLCDFDRVFAEIGHVKLVADCATIRNRVGTHPPVSGWRQLPELRNKLAFLVEVLVRLVATHPFLEQLELRFIL